MSASLLFKASLNATIASLRTSICQFFSSAKALFQRQSIGATRRHRITEFSIKEHAMNLEKAKLSASGGCS